MKMWRAQQWPLENEVVFAWQIIRLLHFMGLDFLSSLSLSLSTPPLLSAPPLSSLFFKSEKRVCELSSHIQLM